VSCECIAKLTKLPDVSDETVPVSDDATHTAGPPVTNTRTSLFLSLRDKMISEMRSMTFFWKPLACQLRRKPC
jgi:hypothetical protein